MNHNANNSAMEKYAELMIEKIKEVNVSDWKKPWFTPSFVGVPQNLSGRAYSNLNKALLYLVCDIKTYQTPVFLTFNQAQQEKIKILKGAKSFPIMYYDLYIKNPVTGKSINREYYDKLSKEQKSNYKIIPIQKYYNVFNLDQTDFSEKFPEKWQHLQAYFRNESNIETDNFQFLPIDRLIEKQAWVCPIELKQQGKAFFNRANDSIMLPVIGQFPKRKEFYFTALHEMAHSTGHTSRLNRIFGSSFGSIEYAKEELIAELSSAVSGRDLGLSILPRKENAQYLKSWLSAITDDPKFLMSILSDVNKATTMITSAVSLENKIEKRTILETTEKLKSISVQYAELGYSSISEFINKYFPYYIDILKTNSSGEYSIEQVKIQSSKAKGLFGDIILSVKPEKPCMELSNLRIKDFTTGLIDPLQTNGIEINKIQASEMKNMLSGGKTEIKNTGTGLSQLVGLNKTPLGWSFTIGKQTFSITDAQAGI